MSKAAVRFATLSLLALSAAACGAASDKDDLEAIDARLGNKANADPALTQALEDQIMVDPALTQQSNEHSVRPPDEPFQSPIPPDAQPAQADASPGQTLGARAAEQANAAKSLFDGCVLDVSYSMQFSTKLPPELSLHPKAQVSEAAGSDSATCRLRAVSFAAPMAPQALASWYATQAQRAGYVPQVTPDGKGLMVSATRASDRAAFYIVLQPAAGGTAGDIVTNRGR